jgi:adenosylmethionine---8-amino-7-oxononanoate aminotransferase
VNNKNSIWHPFTQMSDFASEEQVVIERGEGSYLIDTDGKRYLDGISSLWVNVHGHGHPALNASLKEQIDKISHSTLLGLSNRPAIEYAETLLKVCPQSLKHVFYSDSGSTSVEIALKIAFQYFQQSKQPKKTKFVYFENSYHGDTIGSVGVGGIDLFHSLYRPLLFDAFKTSHPYFYRSEDASLTDCRDRCLRDLEKTLQEHHQEIAACILEPLVQGAAGIITQPDGFLKGVRKLCTSYDVLLIIDEVATGFGRTGTLFACEQEAVEPDLMCVAKGITGGYLPLAATLSTDKIYQAFLGNYEDLKTFFHGHTYTGNPLACVLAKTNLEIFREENTLMNVGRRRMQLQKRLQPFFDLPAVGDIRQKGLMAGIELVSHRKTKASYPLADKIPHKIVLEARRRGLIIRPLGPVMVLMPPLSINEAELDQLCDVLFDSIKKVTNG